jgi:glycosyltransferase involved in cell wall biosynthesis
VVFSDAMQAQRPVIAMPVGDLPRIVKSLRCGLLADAVSKEALALAMHTALNTPTSSFSNGLSLGAESFDIVSAAKHFLRQIA